MNLDIFYMKKAIKLAKKGEFTTAPNPNVGCIIVNNKKIVGKGWHYKTGAMHAEVIALKMAGNKSKGATMYVTLEPCSNFGHTPPCCNALIKCGLLRVVIALQDPNPLNSGKGIKFLIQHGLIVKTNVLAKESKKINKGFCKRMTTGYPFIQLKLGSTLDGRTATINGNSKWITSIESRNDVQYFRAKSSAILSSSNTIINDNPFLNVRHNKIITNKYFTQPLRIILDSQNTVNLSHKFIYQKGKVFLIRIKKDNINWPKNIKQIIVNSINNKIDLNSLFLLLGKKQINTVFIESGSTLSGILIQKKIVDEIIIYMAPKILGNISKPLFTINKPLQLISDSIKLIYKDIRKIGPDIRMILKPIYHDK